MSIAVYCQSVHIRSSKNNQRRCAPRNAMDDYELGLSMDCLDKSLPIAEDGDHGLLEAPLPAYTDVTVRRAFATWLHCGHKAKFRLICDYYHRLEAMEDKLSAEERAQSRYHEFNLLVNGPPNSVYQMQMFPDLYSRTHVHSQRIANLQSMTNEKCIFKLEGFHEIAEKNSAGVKETHVTCKEIRKYCNAKALTLRAFLKEFEDYTNKCGLERNFWTLTSYISRKRIHSEIETVQNYPKTFNFLEDDEEESNCLLPVVKEENGVNVVPLTKEYDNVKNNENKQKLNKPTAEFFEAFNNRYINNDKTLSCWIFDNNKFENLKHTEEPKNIDSWSLLKSLMSLNGTNKLPTLEEYKI